MTVVALAALTGCDSTQQRAARARLEATRIVASSTPTIVRHRNAAVRIVAVTLLRGAGGTAITVRLRNLATHPLNDLPISVGVVEGLRRHRYLNATANSDYFESHVASIAAGASLTWVFTTTRKLPPAAATPFAVVGALPSARPTAVGTLPRIEIATPTSPTSSRGAARIRVKVTNASAVPQDLLQIYALGLERGGYVAAGRVTVSHLGTASSETVGLTLVGRPHPTSIELEALPTVFQ